MDENIGASIQRIFRNAGHDTQTVRDQKIEGCSDETLFKTCCSENRCLVTLDLDFSNVLRYSPESSAGIAIIRAPKSANITVLRDLARQFLQVVDRMPIAQQLWIIEPGRIRIHQEEKNVNKSQ
ncbi:MAG: DUF5615 family PIN-like protein [Thermacetogeniaceae bacterium]